MKHTEGSCHRRRQRCQTLFKQVIFPPSSIHELLEQLTGQTTNTSSADITGVTTFQILEGKETAEGRDTPLVGILSRKRRNRQKTSCCISSCLSVLQRSVTFPSRVLIALPQQRETITLSQDAQEQMFSPPDCSS